MITRQYTALLATALCWNWLAPAQLMGQQAVQTPAKAAPAKTIMPTFKANTNIVLVNLTVKDRQGNLVTNLKPSDITVLEDGKPQHILSFEYEDIDKPVTAAASAAAAESGPGGTMLAGATPGHPKAAAAAAKAAAAGAKAAAAGAQPAAPGTPATAASASPAATPGPEQYRDHRLLVLYFDLTTMQPEDVANVMQQADNFVSKQMQPADLVAIATLGNTLQVNQDFTANKDLLLHDLAALNPNTSNGFQDGSTGSTDGTADDGNTFAADDSEFNIANADRSLQALGSVCDMLAPIQQRKSVLYFTSGIQRSGVDNEFTLRSAVNSCVKANTAVNSVDALGLQALPPGGDASGGSIRGSSAFNGGAQMSTLNAQFAQQETISTLASDTGGRSFLDSNNFATAYAKVEADTSSYYLISYSSNDSRQNGKYRKIKVVLHRPGLVAINPRPGYFAPRDIAHMDTADRNQQLQDELEGAVSDHSLEIYLADGYLRLNRFRYYVPVAITIPGNEIPLHGINPKAAPEVDIAGEVLDQAGRELDHVRQTIKLTSVAGAGQNLQNRNLQYRTGFMLSPGQKYDIRFAARENQTGQMGAFDAVLTIPNLSADETKMPHVLITSSVLVGSQLEAVRRDSADPLTATGHALVMNVNHVFTSQQQMYIYFEVYDPTRAGKSGDAIDLVSNVAFYHGKVKVFQSDVLTTRRLTDPFRGAAVVQMDIPLSQLQPGYYLCQVNAVDAAGAKFAFPRIPILILRPRAAAAASTSSPLRR